MLRDEARALADQFCPPGFAFNSLELLATPGVESEDDRGVWCATFVAPRQEDGTVPTVIERFPNEYSPGDPPPATDTTDTTGDAEDNGDE